jgi:hypothetical protein
VPARIGRSSETLRAVLNGLVWLGVMPSVCEGEGEGKEEESECMFQSSLFLINF